MAPQALAALEAQYSVIKFAFSDGLEAFNLSLLAEAPRGGDTRILSALESAKGTVEGSALAGFVVVTDAVDREGANALEERLKGLGAPVFVLTPPLDQARDLALSAADEAPMAFVRNTRTIKVVLTGRGVDGLEHTVKIEAPGMPVQLRTVKFEGNPAEVVLTLPFKPMRVGRQVVRISTPLVSGEQDAANNTLLIPMDVVRDRLRVLLVAGAPTWDVRFLRRLLKEDPGVDLVSFFILRTPEDSSEVPESELSLIPFPERELFEEQLHTFDVVLFVDFNFGPYSVGRYLGRVRRFVEQDGGGFAMVGGVRSFFEGAYHETEIADLLPVEIARKRADLRPFIPVVAAPNHPILSLGYSGELQDLFTALPLMNGRNRLGQPKPGASVVLAHPEARKGHPEPILVAAPVGRGRALALAVDSLWRWQLPATARGGKNRPYYRFWHNTLRWLSGDPAFSRLTWEELPAERARGEALNVVLRLRGEDWQPSGKADVELQVRPGQGQSKRFVASTDEEGRVRFELGELAPGDWHLKASAQKAGVEVARAEAVVIAGQPSQERRVVGPDAVHARRLAQLSGGRHADWSKQGLADFPFDPARRGERIEAVESDPLWNHPVWLLAWLLPGLVAIALRRRWQLA
jgi:hypothetical protein